MMDGIKEDLRAIRVDVAEIKTTMAVNTESLKNHMERTALNERRVEKLEDWALKLLGALVGGCLLAILGWVGKLLLG